MDNYTVEILHKGEEVYLVDLMSISAEGACRSAKNAIWMKALRDGREWRLDDIDARIYEGSVETMAAEFQG